MKVVYIANTFPDDASHLLELVSFVDLKVYGTRFKLTSFTPQPGDARTGDPSWKVGKTSLIHRVDAPTESSGHGRARERALCVGRIQASTALFGMIDLI